MAKETKKVEAKKKSPKTPQNPPVVTPVEEPVVVTPGEVTTQNIVNSVGTTGLDANHRVDLLKMAHETFVKDPNASKRFSLELVESMSHITAMGIVSALVDEAQFGESTFTAVLRAKAYPQLVLAAHDMGIKLPDVKSLPPVPGKEGMIELPSDQIKPSAETKNALKKEHEVEQKGAKGEIELDPKKVAEMDDDALKEALTYILITDPKRSHNIKDTLTRCVDFMREFRMAQANKAQNVVEAMETLDSRSVYDWLNDAFSYVKPTHLLSGIGMGMRTVVDSEKGGISAFLILRQTLTDKDGTICWDDQSIADAVRAIVIWSCNDAIAKDTTAIEKLPTNSSGYKEEKAKFEKSIAHFNDIIDAISNPNFDFVDGMLESLDKDDKIATKMAGRICKAYYPETLKNAEDYKNLNANIQQRAGIIANMFREPGNTNLNYSEANLSDLVEYTEEEKVELRKEAAEAKKEESKNA